MATKSTTKTTKGKAKATSAGRRKSVAKSASRSKGSSAKTAAAPKTTKTSKTAAQAPAAPVAKDAIEATPKTAIAALRRPDLIQAVADRVSLKRSDAKMVFDVVLDEIGKALDANEEVVAPPLGKLMVKKRVQKPGGEMLTLKLKRADVDPSAGDVAPLAKGDEQG